MADARMAAAKPPIERQLTSDRVPHLVGAALCVLTVWAVLFLLGDRLPDGLAVVVLGVFASFGIFLVLGYLFGVVRVSSRRSGEAAADALLATTSEGVVVAAADGSLVYANDRYAELIGASDPAAIATPQIALAAPHGGNEALNRLDLAAASGDEASDEVRVERGSRSQWLRVETRPLALDGVQGYTAWIVSDVTASRSAQENDFVAARHVVSHLDTAAVGFFAARADGVISHLNGTLARWLDIDLTAFRRRELRIDDLFLGDGALLVETVEPDASGRRSVALEMQTADGRVLPVTVLLSGSTSAGARTVGVVLDGAEGTVGMAGEPGIDQRFERFFNRTPVALASIDASGEILEANAAILKMFEGEATPRRSLYDLVPEIARPVLQRALEATRNGRAGIEPVDFVLRGDDPGSERYIRFVLSSLGQAEEGGEVALVQAIESTEQKAIEAAYVQGQKMQAIGQLAGGLAHDFNNVLTSITMGADLLLQNHGAADPSHAGIRGIKADAQRAASLVRQLLAYSRKQTMRPSTLVLADVLSDARMLFTRLAGHARLELEFGPDLWPVRADLGQLEQVLSNLVANARDAMPDGGTITVATRNLPAAEAAQMPHRELPAADFVMVEVIDDGAGMPPEVLGRIFEPFFTTKDVGKGTGLGLAMVYGIVKQSGGFIYAQSEEGRGTRFRILLPRYVPPAKSVEEAEVERKVRGNAGDLSGTGTILVVEDEDPVRANAVKALQMRGYTVHDAADGEEAMEILEELDGAVDLVLSDVVMPVMDGPQLLRELRRVYGRDIRFVFTSGHAEDAFAKTMPVDEEFAFLPKPYSLKDLAGKVKDILSSG